jgi:hypothetical protein
MISMLSLQLSLRQTMVSAHCNASCPLVPLLCSLFVMGTRVLSGPLGLMSASA